jgi:ubiquinone/menaquinone biosynthesis C-methylase UbiE
MSFYDRYCLPHLINFACNLPMVRVQRQRVVPLASGRVLEVGMGSGLNLPFYDANKVDHVFALEPSEGMRRKAASAVDRAPFSVEWLDLPGEQIPLEDDSVDTVVLTYTLCTIPDWRRAMHQMRRVLKPGGKLVFSEHGQAPEAAVRRWQNRLNPVWSCFAGGCQLNRPIDRCITSSGFSIDKLDTGYLRGPRPVSFNYWGVASPD